MEWPEIKHAVRTDLLGRNLKEPRLRLNALDHLDTLLGRRYPDFLGNPRILLGVGKKTVEKEVASLKTTGNLNGAEKSVLNLIFAQLEGRSPVRSHTDRSGFLLPPTPRQLPPAPSHGPKGRNVKIGLPPLIWEDSRVLILGTMPGEDSLRHGKYYAHERNQFWRILSEVYSEKIGAEYSLRCGFLEIKGLALWDILRSAERAGSLDSAIVGGVANDFASLLRTHPGLRTIVFNGGKAERLFRSHVSRSLISVPMTSIQKVTLPSTSPTPGRNVRSFEEKVGCWKTLATL